MKKQATFEGVINNCDDQVTVRRLLIQIVPEYVKVQIVKGYNKEVDARKRRIKQTK